MSIDKQLLSIIACPKCKGDLILFKKFPSYVRIVHLLYPVSEGIPSAS